MLKKHSFLKDLTALGIEPKGTLMVHMSYKAIGEVYEGGDTVLDALTEYMRDGLLVLPSHTWSGVNKDNPVMDVLYTPSCVGIVPEIFRLRPGVLRSLHPTHSLTAIGKDAHDFLSGEEKIDTPCGKGGAYYKLWERNAQILLIGVDFTRNTYIHGIEEWDDAEGTISDTVTNMYVINYEGMRMYTPQHSHSAPLSSRTFSKLEPYAFQEGILAFGKFGEATTRLAKAGPLRELTASFLKTDKRFLYRH